MISYKEWRQLNESFGFNLGISTVPGIFVGSQFSEVAPEIDKNVDFDDKNIHSKKDDGYDSDEDGNEDDDCDNDVDDVDVSMDNKKVSTGREVSFMTKDGRQIKFMDKGVRKLKYMKKAEEEKECCPMGNKDDKKCCDKGSMKKEESSFMDSLRKQFIIPTRFSSGLAEDALIPPTETEPAPGGVGFAPTGIIAVQGATGASQDDLQFIDTM